MRRLTTFLLFLGIVMLLAWNSSGFFFQRPYYEYYDWASNSLLIERAKHFDDLYGPYSRYSFHHPGPAFFYVYALGEALFFDALHVVPSPYQGQLLINLCLVTGFYVAALNIFARWLPARRRWVFISAAAGFGIVHFSLMKGLPSYDIMDGPSAFLSVWPTHAVALPFLCLLAAGASVGTGRGQDLPLLVLAGGFLIVHVSQPIFIGPTAVLAYLGLVVRCAARERAADGKPTGWRWPLAAWREHPRAHIVTGIFLFLFLLPMVLDLARGSESNLAAILRHARATAHEPHKPLVRAVAFFVQFGAYASYHADQPGRVDFGLYDLKGYLAYLRAHAAILTGWLFVLGIVLQALFAYGRTLTRRGAGVALPDPGIETRRFLAWAAAMTLLNAGLSLFWGTRQEGAMYYYLSWSNFSIYYCAALTAIGVLCSWRWPGSSTSDGAAVRTTRVRRMFVRAAGVGALALLSYLFADRLRIHEYAPDSMRAMHVAVDNAVAASNAHHPGTRKVLIVPDSHWPMAVGAALQLTRAGVPFVVAAGRWKVVFDDHQLWQNQTGSSLAVGLSPFYVRTPGEVMPGVPTDAPTYPLTHDAELTLTPPALEFPPAGGVLDLGFAADANARDYTLAGWASPEPAGAWSESSWAALAFRPQVIQGNGVELLLDGIPYLSPAHGLTRQRVRLYFNGSPVGPEQSLAGAGVLPFVVTAADWNAAASGPDPQISLAFEFPDAAIPAELDPTQPDGDPRDLAVFFRKIRLRVLP